MAPTQAGLTTLVQNLDGLLDALKAHPSMPAIPLSPETPRPLYFTYDFVQRTHDMAAQIAPAKIASKDKAAMATYNDCVGRCAMTKMLVTDTSGKTAMMLGGPCDFGEGVKAAAVKAAE